MVAACLPLAPLGLMHSVVHPSLRPRLVCLVPLLLRRRPPGVRVGYSALLHRHSPCRRLAPLLPAA